MWALTPASSQLMCLLSRLASWGMGLYLDPAADPPGCAPWCLEACCTECLGCMPRALNLPLLGCLALGRPLTSLSLNL